MALVTYLLRAELRRRWRTWVALAGLIAIAGGTGMFAIAAWQRTSTAMDRFMDVYQGATVLVAGTGVDRDAVLAVDGVLAADGGEYFFLAPDGPDGRPLASNLGYINPFSSEYGSSLTTMNLAQVLEGSLPDPDQELQIAIDEEVASGLGIGVGDRLPMTAQSPEQFLSSRDDGAAVLDLEGPQFAFEVTAIVRRPSDVVPSRDNDADVIYLGNRDIYLTPAFHRAHFQRDVAGASLFGDPNEDYLELLIAPGTDLDSLRARVAAMKGADAQLILDESDDELAARLSDRAIGLQAAGVLAVGLVIGAAASMLALFAISRLVAEQLAGFHALRALGISRLTAVAAAAVGSLVASTLGAAGAVALAVALSPLSPIGIARRAEPDLGIHADLRTLVLCAAGIVAGAAGAATLMAWRASTRSDRSAEVPRPGVAARTARATSRPGVALGLQLSGRSGGLPATAAGIVLIAVVTVIGSLTFASSAGTLSDEPQRFGWTWDVAVGNPNDESRFDQLIDTVPDQPVVGAAIAVREVPSASFEENGVSIGVPAVAIEPLKGHVDLGMLMGRAPTAARDIALGAVTARQLSVGVGDTVRVGSEDGDSARTMRVTGIALFNDGLLADRIGEGAVMTTDAAVGIEAELWPGVVLVDYAPGTTDAAGRLALQDVFGRTVLQSRPPSDLDSLGRVRALPLLVAGVVGILAVATLMFALGTMVGGRRRDLAVLMAAGLRPRQAAEALYVHATSLVAVPAALGTLLGLVAGRVSWSLVTRGLGAPDLPTFPLLAAALAVPAALLAASVVATRPARQAARTRPSMALRAE